MHRHLARLKSLVKYNFEIEINGQGHEELMYVRDTSYHSDTLTCQTNYDYVKGQKN